MSLKACHRLAIAGTTPSNTIAPVENQPLQDIRAAEAEAMQADSVPGPSTSSIQAEGGTGATEASAIPGNSAADAIPQVKGDDQEGRNEQAGSSKGGKQQRRRTAGGKRRAGRGRLWNAAAAAQVRLIFNNAVLTAILVGSTGKAVLLTLGK